jgi:hypothetical protein
MSNTINQTMESLFTSEDKWRTSPYLSAVLDGSSNTVSTWGEFIKLGPCVQQFIEASGDAFHDVVDGDSLKKVEKVLAGYGVENGIIARAYTFFNDALAKHKEANGYFKMGKNEFRAAVASQGTTGLDYFCGPAQLLGVFVQRHAIAEGLKWAVPYQVGFYDDQMYVLHIYVGILNS